MIKKLTLCLLIINSLLTKVNSLPYSSSYDTMDKDVSNFIAIYILIYGAIGVFALFICCIGGFFAYKASTKKPNFDNYTKEDDVVVSISTKPIESPPTYSPYNQTTPLIVPYGPSGAQLSPPSPAVAYNQTPGVQLSPPSPYNPTQGALLSPPSPALPYNPAPGAQVSPSAAVPYDAVPVQLQTTPVQLQSTPVKLQTIPVPLIKKK